MIENRIQLSDIDVCTVRFDNTLLVICGVENNTCDTFIHYKEDSEGNFHPDDDDFQFRLVKNARYFGVNELLLQDRIEKEIKKQTNRVIIPGIEIDNVRHKKWEKYRLEKNLSNIELVKEIIDNWLDNV